MQKNINDSSYITGFDFSFKVDQIITLDELISKDYISDVITRKYSDEGKNVKDMTDIKIIFFIGIFNFDPQDIDVIF